jgi:hypothetical protein
MGEQHLDLVRTGAPRIRCATPPPLRRGVVFTTSVAVRMGECNHEMPGLPYPAFRMANAEPGGRQAVPLHLAQLDHQVEVGAGFPASDIW